MTQLPLLFLLFWLLHNEPIKTSFCQFHYIIFYCSLLADIRPFDGYDKIIRKCEILIWQKNVCHNYRTWAGFVIKGMGAYTQWVPTETFLRCQLPQRHFLYSNTSAWSFMVRHSQWVHHRNEDHHCFVTYGQSMCLWVFSSAFGSG